MGGGQRTGDADVNKSALSLFQEVEDRDVSAWVIFELGGMIAFLQVLDLGRAQVTERGLLPDFTNKEPRTGSKQSRTAL